MRELSIISETFDLGDGTGSQPIDRKVNARARRLLAFLIWHSHTARLQHKEPHRWKRPELEKLIVAEGAVASALSEMRTLLSLIGERDRVEAPWGGTICIPTLDGLECDLVALLEAVAASDSKARDAVIDRVGGRAALEQLRASLGAHRRERRADLKWVDELCAYLEAPLGKPKLAPRNRPAIDDPTRLYLQTHVARCQSIDPRQMRRSNTTSSLVIPLDDIYVSLRVGPENAEEVEADREVTEPAHVGDRARDDLLVMHDPASRPGKPFTELLQADRWSIVIGDPGAGKTTLLHWLALYHARALLDPQEPDRLLVAGEKLGLGQDEVDLGPVRLPILVRVAEYAAAGDSELPDLADFLGRHSVADEPLAQPAEAAHKIIMRWLEAGRAIVLLDGLDEISDAARRAEVVTAVERFVRDHVKDPVGASGAQPWQASYEGWWRSRMSAPAETGGNQILVTSRRHGYKQAGLADPFVLVEAQSLDLPSINRFCQRWALVVERDHARNTDRSDDEVTQRAEQQAGELSNAVTAHPNVRKLATNPLLLTVLAMLQRESKSGQLPSRRLELYQQATQVLVERRMTSWSFKDVLKVLGPFALWLRENSTAGYASEAQLIDQLRVGAQRVASENLDAHIADFIDAAQSQAGLLVEQGSGRFGFMHGTFGEYLAAVELTRDLSQFHDWLLAHMHDARWIEVVLLGIALIAERHQEAVDDLLRDVLKQQPNLESLLHHDLLLVADCLAETESGSPQLVTDVIDRLLQAGCDAERLTFAALQSRIKRVLVTLLERRPRIVTPRLLQALAETELAQLATELLSTSLTPTLELLEALDLACRHAEYAPLACVVRHHVAVQLFELGVEIPAELMPIGSLFATEDARYREQQEMLAKYAPALGQLVASTAEVIDPALHTLVRWTLSVVAPQLDEDAVDPSRIVAEHALDILPRQRGADFGMLALFAFMLDPEGTRERLATGFADGTLSAPSATRVYAEHPDLLPDPDRFSEWLRTLGSDAATALLERHNPGHASLLYDLAWQALADQRSPHAVAAATAILTRTSSENGYLPVSRQALLSLRVMFGREDQRLLAEALQGRLRMVHHYLPFGAQLPSDLLEEMLADPDDPCNRLAAVLLAVDSHRPLTARQYDLIADAIAHDETMRAYALQVLMVFRDARLIPDEVMERAQAHFDERLDAGDIAAASSHEIFFMNLQHSDVPRLRLLINAPGRWHGARVVNDAALKLLAELPELDAEAADRLIDACRTPTRSHLPTRLDVDTLEDIALRELPGDRDARAALAAVEITLVHEPERLTSLIERLAEVDVEAAAVATRAAAHCVPVARSVTLSAGTLAEVAKRSLPVLQAGSVVSGALLAVDVLTQPNAEQVLDRLTNRTFSYDQMASAMIAAIDTDHGWPGIASPLPIVTGVAEVAARFAANSRGITTLVEEARRQLTEDSWTARRAALYLLDHVAAAHPGQFLQAAQGTDLREALLEIGLDRESYSVRRLVISLLSHFRRLDQPTIDLIAGACRDQWIVAASILERCHSFGASEDIDMEGLFALMSTRNAYAIRAGAVLTSSVAALPSEGRGSRARRREAIDALAAVTASPDPLLDSVRVTGELTLRQSLHAQLGGLVWEVPAGRPITRSLGQAAVERVEGPQSADEAPPLEATSRIGDAIRIVAQHDWFLQTSTAFTSEEFSLRFDSIWPGEADPMQVHLFNIAVHLVLETRVGVSLGHKFSPRQLDEFEPLAEAEDDKAAFEWLRRNMPSYKEIVRREAVRLRSEIVQTAQQVRALIDEVAVLDDERIAMAVNRLLARPSQEGKEMLGWANGALRAAHQLASLGRLADGVRIHEYVVEAFEPDDQVTQLVRQSYAGMLLENGKPLEAIDLFERALAGIRRHMAADQPEAIRALVMLLESLEHVEPQRAIDRASEEIEALAGGDPAAVCRLRGVRARLLRNVGVHYENAEEAEPAKRYYERAMADVEAAEESSSFRYVLRLDLGDIAVAQGDPETAISHYETGLTGLRGTGGSLNEQLRALLSLILALGSKAPWDALDRAEMEHALLISAGAPPRAIAALHHTAGVVAHMSARNLLAAGEFKDAEPLLLRAESEYRAIGQDVLELYVVLHDLGECAAAREDHEAMIERYEEALEGKSRLRGLVDPDTLVTLEGYTASIAVRKPHAAIERLEAYVEQLTDDVAQLEAHRVVLWNVAMNAARYENRLADAAEAEQQMNAELDQLAVLNPERAERIKRELN